MTASGRTQALVTLRVADVRAVRDEDLISVRQLVRLAASLAPLQVGAALWRLACYEALSRQGGGPG